MTLTEKEVTQHGGMTAIHNELKVVRSFRDEAALTGMAQYVMGKEVFVSDI